MNPTPFPPSMRFLLHDPSIVLEVDAPGTAEWARTADLLLVVDTGEWSRIGRVANLFRGIGTAVIDHHPEGGDRIPGPNVRDVGAAAAGEVVWRILAAAGGEIPDPVAPALFVALMTDTGGFRFSNTSAETLRIASELARRGAEPELLHRRIMGTLSERRLRLLQASLPTIRREGPVAWITVPEALWIELDASAEDIEGFVDYPRSLEGVEVGLLFRGMSAGTATKVSLRSNGPADVNRVARRFGGGGHVRASGATLATGVEEAVRLVVAAAREEIEERSPDPGGTHFHA